MNQDLDSAWDVLELTQDEMERGGSEWGTAVDTVGAALGLFLAHTPQKIVEKTTTSRYPSSEMVSWKVYEACRIQDIPLESVNGLREYWNKEDGLTLGAVLPVAKRLA